MVELLSPAGDKACFMAAIEAGADAVYVGGDKYGARAYAKNFTTEELIECLDVAHLFNKKVYLTINTLMKEKELDELVPFLRPYYEAGLDGVIIQDLGALLKVKEAFPHLELHASTQMTVTGPGAAKLLKNYGVSRVVPARELSLSEIVTIKKEADIEVETFIHGAMCYGYSGQCLFSSTIGSRSGNRGRCAGPCRLPYYTEYCGDRLNKENELYQLSLKDLCVLEILPQLLEAGIDSFKIEGRMKTPEYVSFVTAMYRKYIDLYETDPIHYHVSKEDRMLLQNKFSRGSVQSGYYFIHNGRSLLTLDKPGYRSFDPADTKPEHSQPDMAIQEKETKIDLIGHFKAIKNEPIYLTVYRDGFPKTPITVSGAVAGEAQKCAATMEDVKKQLYKTGNTVFSWKELNFEMDNDLFLPNKCLNELRRNALEQMQECLLKQYRRDDSDVSMAEKKSATLYMEHKPLKENSRYLHVDVRTEKQLEVLGADTHCKRVYLSTDALGLCQSKSILLSKRKEFRDSGIQFFLRFPPVTRQKTMKILDSYRNIIKELEPDGLCIGNPETLSYVQEVYPKLPVVTDAGMYVFNSKTAAFYAGQNCMEHILPYELHKKEIAALIENADTSNHAFLLPIYGYIPAMESAGCLLKTNGKCRRNSGEEIVILTDRQKEKRAVVTHCDRCENTIYNCVPLSLHKELLQIFDLSLSGLVLKFTIESPQEVLGIIKGFESLCDAASAGQEDAYRKQWTEFPVTEFTKGHFLKGVE